MIDLVVLDTETLALSPKEPQNTVVDEIGLAKYRGDETTMTIERLNNLTNDLFAVQLQPGGLIEQIEAEAGFTLANVKLPLIEQVYSGRKIEKSTVEWHRKRGYNPELEVRYGEIAPAMAEIQAHCKDSVVYCRGQDFDFPLVNGLLPGKETICNFRKARDLRTAFDELLMDDRHDLLFDDRIAASLIFSTNAPALALMLRLNKLRKDYGHRSLNDAVLDLLQLLTARLARREFIAGLSKANALPSGSVDVSS